MNDDDKHVLVNYNKNNRISEEDNFEPSPLDNMLRKDGQRLPKFNSHNYTYNASNSFDNVIGRPIGVPINQAPSTPIDTPIVSGLSKGSPTHASTSNTPVQVIGAPITPPHVDVPIPSVPMSSTLQISEEVISLAGITPKHVEWLWDNRIPIGKLTLLQGEPGVGKSYLALKLAAVVTKGGTLPGKDKEDEYHQVPRGNVIYQSAEDDIADTIVPRFLKMSGDRSCLFYINETEKALTLNDERIKQALESCQPKLMILDPLAAYLGRDVDINKSNEVRPIFAKLAKWAEQYNCAIVMITHLSKSKYTKGSVYASLGSIDMAAACRCILGVRYIYNTDEKLVYQVKNNVGMKPKPVKFAIDLKYGINWRGVFESSKKREDGSTKLKSKTKLDEAKEATLEMLKTGINTSRAMKREYERKGIKPWAYNTARKELQIDGFIKEPIKMKGKFAGDAEAKWEIMETKEIELDTV